MNKKLLLLCSKSFPGSAKVILHLRGILSDTIDCEIRNIGSFLNEPLTRRIKFLRHVERKVIRKLYPVKTDQLVEYGNNIIFAGWDHYYEIILNELNKHDIAPSLLICSTLGQSELTFHELPGLSRILEYFKAGKLKYALLNRRLYDSIGHIINNARYFPYAIDLKIFEGIRPQCLEGVNIDLFCALRSGKNILNQVLALKIGDIPGKLHINFSNPVIDKIIDELKIEIVRHSWLKDKEYYSLIAGMTASLQVTFTESFSYAVCERMCLSMPVLTSYDVDLVADDEFLSKYLCINALDTPKVIARSLKKILSDVSLRNDLASAERLRIEQVAKKNNKSAIDCIKDLF